MRMEMRMKKLITGIALAAFFTFGIAGQAAAAMDMGQLFQCIYEGTTDAGYEFATDVGSAMNLTDQTVYTNQPAENLSNFDTTVWADMYAGFSSQHTLVESVGTMPFHKDYTSNVFFATTPAAASHASDLPNPDQFITYNQSVAGLMGSVTSGTGGLKAETPVQVTYWNKIENLPGTGHIQGIYSGFMTYEYRDYGFASLAPLDDGAGSYVDMLLWQYHDYNGFFEPDTEGLVNIHGEYEDTYVARIRIGLDENGDLYTTTNPVPIPGAVWLFGSGLLGLVGIRRRKSA